MAGSQRREHRGGVLAALGQLQGVATGRLHHLRVVEIDAGLDELGQEPGPKGRRCIPEAAERLLAEVEHRKVDVGLADGLEHQGRLTHEVAPAQATAHRGGLLTGLQAGTELPGAVQRPG